MTTIHLIGYGRQKAVPASELQPGDTLIWNYGYRSKVLSITKSEKSSIWTFHLQSNNGIQSDRRMKKTRLVAVE